MSRIEYRLGDSERGLLYSADDIVGDRDDGKVWVIEEASGNFGVLIAIVFADHESDALDIAMDEGKLRPIPQEEWGDYAIGPDDCDHPERGQIECSFLGNAGEPYNLDNTSVYQIDRDQIQDALDELDNRREYTLRENEFGRRCRTLVFDEKPVRCPHVGAYGEYASPGDFIVIEGYGGHYARVLGRIVSPVDCCEGFILALVLSHGGEFCFERWIDPKEVFNVSEKPPKALWAWFTSPIDNPIEAVDLASYGTLSASQIDHIDDSLAEIRQGRERQRKNQEKMA
jgi:hypothetical protein